MPGRNNVRRRRASRLWTPQGGLFAPPSAFDDSAHGLSHEYYFIPFVGGASGGVDTEGGGTWEVYDTDGELVAEVGSDEQNFSEIRAGRVFAGNVVTKNDTGITDYYIADNGDDDANTGLTSGSPFQTIQHALDLIPKYNIENVTIHLAGSDNYYGNIYIEGFIGSGSITITGTRATVNVIGTITVDGCSQEIQVDSLGISDDGGGPTTGGQQGTITVNFSTHVQFVDIDVFTRNASTSRAYSIYFNGSIGDAHGCYLTGTGGGTGTYVVAANQSVVRLGNNTGPSGGAGTSYSAQGSLIMMNGTRPQNGTATSNGGLINGSATATTGSATATQQSPLVSQNDPTDSATWVPGDGAWSTPTSVGQGRHPADSNRGGVLIGAFLYNQSSIATVLSAKTVDRVEVKFVRQRYSGFSSSVQLHAYEHNESSLSGTTAPTISNGPDDLGSLRWGEEKWMVIPNAYAEQMRDGNAKGIAFYSRDRDDYMFMEGYDSTRHCGRMRIFYH